MNERARLSLLARPLAAYGIDVLTAILRSAEEGRAKSKTSIVTTCTQPEALGIEEARALLRDDVAAPAVEAAAE